MSIVSIVLSIGAAVMAWFTVGPGWLPLATVSVAALLAFWQTVTALRAKDWGHWSLRALVIALVVLIALPAIGRVRPKEIPAHAVSEPGPLALPAADGAANAGPLAVISNDPPPAQTIEPTAAVDRSTQLAKRADRTRFHFDARVRALGEGVDPAFAYVRDAIGFDSYPGVLRGERGTFLARAGNSWDRALLLTALLRAKGVRTRYATARLDDATAQQVFERLFVGPVPAAGSQATSSTTPFEQRLRDRAARDLAVVRSALTSAWPADTGVTSEQVIEELRNHVWVQAEVGAGWQDLDPSLPGAEPGRPLARSERTFEEIPEENFQHVTIRVLAETLSDGQLSTTPRLEWSARSAEVLGQKMILAHVPSGTGAGGRLARLAGEQWRPALWLDGKVHMGDVVRFGASSSAGSFFFGEESSALVSERLEIELDLTGGRSDKSERVLYNRLTDAARAVEVTADALASVPMLNDGPVPALALHNLWFTAGGHDLATYAESIAAISARIADPAAELPDPETHLQAIALANFPFLVWSEHRILPSLNDVPGVRLYADAPRVLIFSASPSAGGPGGITGEYDLHRDRVRAIARDAGSLRAAVERKVWFGLLEGALEHELTAAEVGDAGGTAGDFVTTSAMVSSLGAAVVRDGAVDGLAALAGDAARANRMRVAVARGSTLVVPRPASGQPARGWWEIAANGDTRAVIDGDLGGSSYSLGKGIGPWRSGGGMGTPDGRMPRLPRPGPSGGGSGSQEYLTLLTTIALGVIIVFELIAFTIHLRAVMRGITVLESMDRDFGSE